MNKAEKIQAEKIARDLAMVKSPAAWPRWPVLPLVNRHGQMADDDFTAIMVDTGSGPIVYFGNMLMLPPGKTWLEVLGSMRSKTYESYNDLVADYRVD